ncbi:MAG: hypothetical protein EKK53_28225 [Burkholderiales bacterium]|jgi:hypothetical protein|nr:MAG: hypothetical protein EKK53_28225 [Burkholderiales bacterium]
MARNAHIQPAHVEAIQRLIRSWGEEKISWDAVCKAAGPILGYKPSRSGLSSHDALLKAFQAQKKGLRVRPPAHRALPGSLASAAQRLAAKDAEIAELRHTISKFEEQFERWQYNARLRRVTLAQLDEPMPHIDRTS